MRRSSNPGITVSGVTARVNAWSRGAQIRVEKQIRFIEVPSMFRPRKETEGSHMGGFPVLTKGVRDVS